MSYDDWKLQSPPEGRQFIFDQTAKCQGCGEECDLDQLQNVDRLIGTHWRTEKHCPECIKNITEY